MCFYICVDFHIWIIKARYQESRGLWTLGTQPEYAAEGCLIIQGWTFGKWHVRQPQSVLVLFPSSRIVQFASGIRLRKNIPPSNLALLCAEAAKPWSQLFLTSYHLHCHLKSAPVFSIAQGSTSMASFHRWAWFMFSPFLRKTSNHRSVLGKPITVFAHSSTTAVFSR